MHKQPDKVAQTKKKIENAFIGFYGNTDIEKISIKAITSEAQVYRSTFYLYYQDIYDLLSSIEQAQLLSFRVYVEKQLPLESVEVGLRKLVAYFSSNGELLYLLMSKGRNGEFREQLGNVIQDMVQEVMGIKQSDGDLELTMSYIANTFMFFESYCFERQASVEAYYPKITELLHHGVVSALQPYVTSINDLLNKL